MFKRLAKWFDNYWYHYKFHTIFVASFLFVFIFTLSTCLRRPEADITIMAASPRIIESGDVERMKLIVAQYLEDYDGNGKKQVEAKWFFQMREGDEAELGFFNQRIITELAEGECFIFMLDKSTADDLAQKGALEPLNERYPEYVKAEGDGKIYYFPVSSLKSGLSKATGEILGEYYVALKFFTKDGKSPDYIRRYDNSAEVMGKMLKDTLDGGGK